MIAVCVEAVTQSSRHRKLKNDYTIPLNVKNTYSAVFASHGCKNPPFPLLLKQSSSDQSFSLIHLSLVLSVTHISLGELYA